jgi:hypothetical protein
MVNSLLTISIKVNVPISDMSRVLTTGDDHEVQKGDCGPWAPELASRLRLERSWRQRLSNSGRFRPDSSQLDDLRLGVDRLSASELSPIQQRHDFEFAENARAYGVTVGRFVTKPISTCGGQGNRL